ncbi:MAG: hypothetical protein JSS22_09835, partial [Proteobacteria bacterium]|nr:hypothetical protein [Pseudomonadota bacterium]
SLYELELSGPPDAKLQELLSALIDAAIPATKAKPETAARLNHLLDATQQQISDLSKVIDELLKNPESIVPKAGYFPPNITEMIKARAEGIGRIEDIKAAIEGISKDIVFLPPAAPTPPAQSDVLKTVLIAMGITGAALVAIIVLRHILQNMSSLRYGARMQRIRESLPWRRGQRRYP